MVFDSVLACAPFDTLPFLAVPPKDHLLLANQLPYDFGGCETCFSPTSNQWEPHPRMLSLLTGWYCGWTKSCTALKPWLKPLFVGIYRSSETRVFSAVPKRISAIRSANGHSSMSRLQVGMRRTQRPSGRKGGRSWLWRWSAPLGTQKWEPWAGLIWVWMAAQSISHHETIGEIITFGFSQGNRIIPGVSWALPNDPSKKEQQIALWLSPATLFSGSKKTQTVATASWWLRLACRMLPFHWHSARLKSLAFYFCLADDHPIRSFTVLDIALAFEWGGMEHGRGGGGRTAHLITWTFWAAAKTRSPSSALLPFLQGGFPY